MDQKTHDKGLEIRKAVLGEAYVNNALKNSDSFNKPFQELVTEYCWGAVWGREELPRKTRSMLNLAMISILNRPHELKMHIKGALTNGVSRDEIREIFMQVSIYAGIPAGVDSFRIAREVFAAERSNVDKRLKAHHHGNRIHRPREDGLPDGAPPDRGRASAHGVRHAEGGRRQARRARRAGRFVAEGRRRPLRDRAGEPAVAAGLARGCDRHGRRDRGQARQALRRSVHRRLADGGADSRAAGCEEHRADRQSRQRRRRRRREGNAGGDGLRPAQPTSRRSSRRST